jgi:hypothetical protein
VGGESSEALHVWEIPDAERDAPAPASQGVIGQYLRRRPPGVWLCRFQARRYERGRVHLDSGFVVCVAGFIRLDVRLLGAKGLETSLSLSLHLSISLLSKRRRSTPHRI